MKVNLISLDNRHSLTQDNYILINSLKKFYKKKKIEIFFYSFHTLNCKVGDITIFVGIINNYFLKFSPINILVLDHHKFDKTWFPYLKKINYIITKTDYSTSLISNHFQKENIIQTGWRIEDK